MDFLIFFDGQRLKAVESEKKRVVLNKDFGLKKTSKGGWSQARYKRIYDELKSERTEWLRENLSKSVIRWKLYENVIAIYPDGRDDLREMLEDSLDRDAVFAEQKDISNEKKRLLGFR